MKFAGRTLMVLALIFIGRELLRHWPTIVAWRPDATEIAYLAALSFVYGGAMFLLAENWHRIVGAFAPEPRRRTYHSFTATQIAKYVPGNVMHLVGRAAYLRGGRIGDAQLGLATLIELGVMAAAAVLVVALAAIVSPLGTATPPLLAEAALPVAICLSLACLAGLFAPWPPRLAALAPRTAAAMLVGMLFLVVLGGVFRAVLDLLATVPLIRTGAAAVLAWFVGFVTPGAPGGLGTREATLILLLDGFAAEKDILLAVVLFRAVTILGDLICFAAGQLLFRKLPS